MEINIINNEKTTFEFEIVGAEQAIPEMLVGRLAQNDSVEFAAYRVDHPLVGSPRIIVKTKSKDALDLTVETLEEIGKEVSELRKALRKKQ